MADKDKMALWNAVWQTDPQYTTPVEYGKRKFTAIDAYRQIMAATERWGPVGTGWGWTATFQNTADGTVCWCILELWYEKREQHFTTVGGAALDKKGEGQKKALTDAITKGLSYLGFNADIFLGMFEDNKYVEERRTACQNDHRPGRSGDTHVTGGQAADGEIASGASLKAFHARGMKISGTQANWDAWRPQVVTWASAHRVTSSAQMTQGELSAALDYMENNQQPTGA